MTDDLDLRDFVLFGRNVRYVREFLGYSMRDFATFVGIGVDTIARIQRGQSCSIRIQNKIADAVGMNLIHLWEPDLWMHRRTFFSEAPARRWHFKDVRSAKKWPLNESPGRTDPDSIQDATERKRLGITGLANMFFTSASCHLSKGLVSWFEVEVFKRQAMKLSEHTLGGFLYCLKGSLTLKTEGQTHVMTEGSVFICEGDTVYELSPAHPVPSDSPVPIALCVNFDARRPSPSRARGR